VVNVIRGGTLVVDMPEHHRHLVQEVPLDPGAAPLGIEAESVHISCYHHQAIERLGDGVEVVARAEDGTVEAVVVAAPAWTIGIQWHPEDTWTTDPRQLQLMSRFVRESAGARRPNEPRRNG
jgi:putative glutamine amidotransferase